MRISPFTSKDKLTFAVVNGHEHVIDLTLTDLATQLDARRFARIHRATIVHVSYVQELFPAVDGGVLVRLKDEKHTELSVARDHVRELEQRLGILIDHDRRTPPNTDLHGRPLTVGARCGPFSADNARSLKT